MKLIKNLLLTVLSAALICLSAFGLKELLFTERLLIGEAAYGESGKYRQKAGDASGREVRQRSWYRANWQYVLRYKDRKKAKKHVQFIKQVAANDHIGYDQTDRNTLYHACLKHQWQVDQIGLCECDCSSLQTVAAIYAGVKYTYGKNAPTTTTMVNALKKTGEFDVLTDSQYTQSCRHALTGDIYVAPGYHTFCVLEDAK